MFSGGELKGEILQELMFMPDALLPMSFHPRSLLTPTFTALLCGDLQAPASLSSSRPQAGFGRQTELIARLTDYTCSSSSADASAGC